jgi:hypothetical protein
MGQIGQSVKSVSNTFSKATNGIAANSQKSAMSSLARNSTSNLNSGLISCPIVSQSASLEQGIT